MGAMSFLQLAAVNTVLQFNTLNISLQKKNFSHSNSTVYIYTGTVAEYCWTIVIVVNFLENMQQCVNK